MEHIGVGLTLYFLDFVSEQNEAQAVLAQQDLSTLDVDKLTALSPEVISRQATINIGTIGHVAHGKSTVVKAISGVKVCGAGCSTIVWLLCNNCLNLFTIFFFFFSPCFFQTVRFKSEMIRNITIKLGYANAKIYKSDQP